MMKMPEGYLLRKGDVFTVLATAMYDMEAGATGVMGVLPNGYTSSLFNLDQIQGIHALKWEVGAKVYLGTQLDEVCEVIGIHGDEVWVKYPQGGTQTFKANDLRPWVEPAPVVQEATPTAEHDDDYIARIRREVALGIEDNEAIRTAAGTGIDEIGRRYLVSRRHGIV